MLTRNQLTAWAEVQGLSVDEQQDRHIAAQRILAASHHADDASDGLGLIIEGGAAAQWPDGAA